MYLRTCTAVLSAAALIVLAGCGAGEAKPEAEAGKLEVMASFYPLQYLSEHVGGEHVQVTSLTQPGAEPHDLELTPMQIAEMSKAALVVYESGFQSAVDEAITSSGVKHSVDVAQSVTLLPAEHEHEHDHEHEGESGEGHDHDHGPNDPHVWLDPTNMVAMAKSVADAMSGVDPEHAADYRANAEKLGQSFTDLDGEYRTGLKTCQRREFITSHAAFGYLANRYNLTQIAINGIDPENEPSPARIAAVQKEAKAHGVTTIFTETLVSPAVSRSIAGDLGLKTAVLDPLEGITPESSGTDYPSIMRANLAALEAAGGCSR